MGPGTRNEFALSVEKIAITPMSTANFTMEPKDTLVTIPAELLGPDHGSIMQLSPFDLINMSRSVPMTWFYAQTLDIDLLLASLQKTLADYPVFCGRYNSPATSVQLNNAGVPVHVCTVAEEMTLTKVTCPRGAEPQFNIDNTQRYHCIVLI